MALHKKQPTFWSVIFYSRDQIGLNAMTFVDVMGENWPYAKMKLDNHAKLFIKYLE